MRRPLKKPRVHLIVEGKTEELYFNKLNNNKYFENVTIHSCNAEGINRLLETLRLDEKVNEEIEYRYILIDADNNSRQFNDCLDQFKKHDKKLIIGKKVFFVNREFELFMIKHFNNKKIQKHTTTAYAKELKNILGLKNNYDKSEKHSVNFANRVTNNRTDNAIENIKKMSSTKNKLPSSNLDKMFDIIFKI